MRTRFTKVWCPDCSSMQFAGECGHARVVAPCDGSRAVALAKEKLSPENWLRTIRSGAAASFLKWVKQATAADLRAHGIVRIGEGFMFFPNSRDLVLPPMTEWKEYKAGEGGDLVPLLP